MEICLIVGKLRTCIVHRHQIASNLISKSWPCGSANLLSNALQPICTSFLVSVMRRINCVMSVLSSILPVFLMMNHVKGKFLSVYAWSLLSPGEDHCLPARQLWWCHIWFLQESWDLPPHRAHLQRHWLPLLDWWSTNAFATMLYVNILDTAGMLRFGHVPLLFLIMTHSLHVPNPMTHSLTHDSWLTTYQNVPYDIITDVTMTHAYSRLLIPYVIMTHTD